MATPNYKGQGQPVTSGGGWLGSLLGVSAPTYAGTGQPTAKSSGSGAPAYKPAPIVAPKPATTTAPASPTSATDDDTNAPTAFAIVIPRQVIETD